MVTNLHVEEGNKFLLFSFTTTNLPIQATTKMQLAIFLYPERNFTFLQYLTGSFYVILFPSAGQYDAASDDFRLPPGDPKVERVTLVPQRTGEEP